MIRTILAKACMDSRLLMARKGGIRSLASWLRSEGVLLDPSATIYVEHDAGNVAEVAADREALYVNISHACSVDPLHFCGGAVMSSLRSDIIARFLKMINRDDDWLRAYVTKNHLDLGRAFMDVDSDPDERARQAAVALGAQHYVTAVVDIATGGFRVVRSSFPGLVGKQFEAPGQRVSRELLTMQLTRRLQMYFQDDLVAMDSLSDIPGEAFVLSVPDSARLPARVYSSAMFFVYNGEQNGDATSDLTIELVGRRTRDLDNTLNSDEFFRAIFEAGVRCGHA